MGRTDALVVDRIATLMAGRVGSCNDVVKSKTTSTQAARSGAATTRMLN